MSFLPISKNVSPQNESNNIPPTNQVANFNEKRLNDLAIENIAKQCLGHGYDRLKDQKCNQSLKDFSVSDIEIYDYQTTETSEVGSDETQAIEKLQRNIGFKVDFKKLFNVSPSITLNKTGTTTEKKGHMVYAATFLHSVKFRFKNTPSLKEDVPPALKGDSFINSGRAYAGYAVLFNISYESNKVVNEDIKSGGGALDILQKVGLSLTLEKGKDLKNDKTITNLTHQAKCIGDYSLPTNIFSNQDQILQDLGKIKIDFLERLPSLKNLHYQIDPANDLSSYSVLPQTGVKLTLTEPQPQIKKTVAMPPLQEALINLKEKKPNFYYDLATKIEASSEIKNMLAQYLGELTLTHMLTQIAEIFPIIFKGKREARVDEGYTIIVGDSGVGKSLVTGYLLGEKLQEITLKRNKTGYVYLKKDTSELPVVGHGAAVTTGCETYGRYIDTAGLFATGGEAVNVCNAAAIHLVTQFNIPRRLILVLPSADFDQKRSREVISKIRFLQRIVNNFKENISSILFLVNDTNPKNQAKKVTVIDAIQDTIETLEEEQKKLIPNTWTEMFKQYNILRSKESEDDLKKKLNPVDLKKWMEYQEEIDILRQIPEENIIVTDLLKDGTREEVKAWEAQQIERWKQKPVNSRSQLLNTENLVENGWDYFRNVLLVTVNYFNQIYADKAEQLLLIEAVDKEIIQRKNLINIFNQMNPEESLKQLQAERDGKLQKKELLQRQENADKQTKQRLEKEIRELETDKTEYLYKTLPSYRNGKPTPITPRLPIAFFDSWAFQYNFTNNDPISLVKVERSKSPGTFLSEDTTKMSQGQYQVQYLPKWHGEKKDTEAKVEVFIAKKDSAPNRIAIANKKREINNPQTGLGLVKKLEGYAEKYREINSEIEKSNQNIISEESLKEKVNKATRLCSDHIASINKLKAKYIDELNKINRELESHQDFCQLLANITQMIRKSSIPLDKSEEQRFISFEGNLGDDFRVDYQKDLTFSLPPLIKVFKTNRKATPDDKIIGKGLSNLGNDCFMNASMQLIVNSSFLQFFSNKAHLEGKNPEVEIEVHTALTNFFKNYLDKEALSTSHFRKTFGFPEKTQEDAGEFLLALIKHYNIASISSKLIKKQKIEGNVEELASHGVFSNEGIVVGKDGTSQGQKENAMIIPLPIIDSPEPIDFKFAWDAFMNPLDYPDPAKFNFNDQCFQAKYKEITTFETIQKNLLVQMKRFHNDGQKIATKVVINSTEVIADKTYHLKGFIQHSGLTLSGGHYVTFLESNGQWQHFDDAKVEIVEKEEALEMAQEAYILYFVQKE